MDLRRLRVGEIVTSVSGLALLVSLFGPWYAEPDSPSAWQSLAVLDVVLALIAALAVLLAIVTATQRVPAVPLAMDALVCVAGLIAFVLVAIRVLALPGDADGREWALWLGLAASAGIVVGSLLAMRDERLSSPGRPTDATGRPVSAPPRVEPLPAPTGDLESRG